MFFKKLFSLTILTISLLLLIYTFYKSEIILHGENRNYFKIYFLISSILICYSIIIFFINDKIKQYLIISGVSLIVSLYLFEGYLTFFSKEQPIKEQLLKEQLYKKQTGDEWDKRNKLDIYNDLNKINYNIAVTVTSRKFFDKDYNILPLSGISNSKIIHCNENGYYSIYQSDRYGFNNPDNEWDKKEIEYLLIGPSTINGACVNRPYDITSVLRKIANQTALNLGNDANGPLVEYATLREYISNNVKKVIWFFSPFDLYHLKLELKNEILLKYLNEDFTQNIKLKQNEIDILVRKVINEESKKINIIKKDIVSFLKLDKTRTILHSFLPEDQQLNFKKNKSLINNFIKILNLTKDLVKQNNSELYFVYLPEYNHYKMNYDDSNYILVKNIVNKLKIPFIDLHKEVFLKEQNPLKLFPFELPGHYNIDGYKKVAETIYKFTKD